MRKEQEGAAPAAPVVPEGMLKWAIRELLGALPERRDWFNPDAEKVLRAELAAPAAPDVLTIPAAIMNIPCKRDDSEFMTAEHRMLYKHGHRDARHAAADLVLERADELKALAASAVQVIDAPRVEDDEKRISAAARALSNRSADVCNVDREDNWTFYSEQYMEDARAALAAADALPIARQAQPTDRDNILEEAAKVAGSYRMIGAGTIAAAIRALKSEQKG